MKRLFILFILIVPEMLEAQQYSVYVDSAKNAYEDHDYVASSLYYDSAFAISKAEGFIYYDAACSNSLAGRSKKSVIYLLRAFENGFADFDWMYYDEDLDSIRGEPEYLLFEKKHKDPNTIYYFDILRELLSREVVVITGKRVSLHESNLSRYSLEGIANRSGLPLSMQPSDTVFDFSSNTLEFHDCVFENEDRDFNRLGNLALKTLHISGCRGSLSLFDLDIENLLFYPTVSRNNEFNQLALRNVNLHGVLELDARGSSFEIDSCKFTITLPEMSSIPLAFSQRVDLVDKDAMDLRLNYEWIEIYNSTFERGRTDNDLAPFELTLNAGNLKIVNNSFGHVMQVVGTAGESLNIKWNEFPSHVDLFNLKLPEFECYIPFSQFDNTQFVRIATLDHGAYEMFGDSAHEYSDESLVDQLTAFYKRLYDIYRGRADLTSSNKIYMRLKELEIDYLQMKPDKNLEERMRLRLNQVMGLYTDHATSPGKALIISFYLVLIFGVFYFIFPSEWDRTTKRQLVRDFRLFIEKNEHGYIKPFFKMSRGFLLSYLNAVTLSMNAFITLGFGNIPAVGIARYVCVLQGVLGWFLLSLFTVALLNQVLL